MRGGDDRSEGLRANEGALEAGEGKGEANFEVVDEGEGKGCVDGLLDEGVRACFGGEVCSLPASVEMSENRGDSLSSSSSSSVYLSAVVLSPQRRR